MIKRLGYTYAERPLYRPRLCRREYRGKDRGSLKLTPATFIRKWLPTVDTLRNLFYAPTVEMKNTFDLLRQGSLAA